MKIVLIGPAASGKGSQAHLLETNFNLPHISTGNIFRQIMHEDTPLGREVNKYMVAGQFVPNDIVIKVVAEHLSKPQFKDGFTLDGYPRTLVQAEELDKIANIDMAILIDVPFDKTVERITTRKICPKCGKTFSGLIYKSNVCDRCGTELVQRHDDNIETITRRYADYTNLTFPVIEYYKKQHKLKVIKGDASVDEVFNQIKQLIGK
ncbi:MAG: adenylate kinase family protein [Spirochaetales bacterium]